MPIGLLGIGTLIGIGGSLIKGGIGIGQGRQAAMDAEARGRIGARQVRRQGVETIGRMEMDAIRSGVVATERAGPSNASYTKAKKGYFFGLIGKEEGGFVENQRSYAGRSDTTSLLFDLTEDAISLDASAVEMNAATEASAYRRQALSSGLGGLVSATTTAISAYNVGMNRQIAKGSDDFSIKAMFFDN